MVEVTNLKGRIRDSELLNCLLLISWNESLTFSLSPMKKYEKVLDLLKSRQPLQIMTQPLF